MSRKPAQRRRISHRFRFPIALRFAALIAAISIAVLSWQASRAIGIAGDRLEREINERGIQLAGTIAASIPPEWLSDPRRQRELVDFLGRVRDSSTAGEIRNIIVFDPAGQAVALLANVRVSPGQEVEYPPAKAVSVRITEHKADGMPVRNFSAPIVGPPGAGIADGGAGAGLDAGALPPSPAPGGRVELLLSIGHIRDARATLSTALSRSSWIGSLVAAALALALSLLVTRSIRELVRDIRAVGLGDLEHRSRIDSADEVGDVARALNRMASNLREAERAKIARKALENELAIASKIQKRLVPTERPQVPGVDIAVHWQPAREVGGDYFDFIPIDSEHLGLVIADVSGKGIPAALVMTMTRSLLRMAATANRSPREALIEVDRAISADLRTGLFVTATYAVLDQRTLALSLARAGHNAPLLWLAREKRMQRIEPRGAAIGIDRGRGLVSRELDEEMIRLRPGDVLVLHTDGVTEAKNEKDEDYGEERLARIIESRASASASASSVLEAILEDIESHRGRRMISDDTTIIVLTGTGTSS